jgi:tRNA U34 5-methylaminomethyl-2-thiouridine-forming methyltransferase MnmC
MAQLEIKVTEDGSHTLYNPDLKEHYHSTHGAIQESLHVFIGAGVREAASDRKSLRILEIGFGTGLNCLLTLLESRKTGLLIEYDGLEPFPLEPELLRELNYISLEGPFSGNPDFERIHSVTEGHMELEPGFRLHRSRAPVQSAIIPGLADVIYFDAFAPDVQPDMWTEDVFKKLYSILCPGGILVTYCAKGQVKRNLKAAGFAIESLPGPPGKREMTRGRKKEKEV